MSDSQNKAKPFLIRVFLFFWGVLSGIRSLVMNLIFLVFVLFVIAAVFSPKEEPLPAKAPLLIAPAGVLVDQYSYTDPSSLLLNPQAAEKMEASVRDIIQVIEHASTDDQITALYLQMDYLEGGGISKMEEIGEAINHFKNSGKPVIAFSDNYSQQQYFLASYADEIFMHDLGAVWLTGFGVYRNYLKEVFDKLSVNFHVFRVGEFKDFIEPYTRNDMSEASRAHTSAWLNELWQRYTAQVENQRNLSTGSLNLFINEMSAKMAEVDGDPARYALTANLVDNISSRIERNNELGERFGWNEDESEILYIPYERYRSKALVDSPLETANIALIVASGTIMDGNQPEGSIGGDSLSDLIRKARQDEEIKALVLRIDSGGGSAFASEIIREELQATRDAGIPIVISMGSVAASGGYWIAMASDEVWATPATITGSIGVFGLFPTFEETLDKIGIQTDGVSTTDLAGDFRIDRPLSPLAENVIQQGVESIYDHFIKLVADARGSTAESIHEIAQGRVWTGTKALELGLVDHLGGLNGAIRSAADLANLGKYKVKLIERELNTYEKIVKELIKESATTDLSDAFAQQTLGMDTRALRAIVKIFEHNKMLVNPKAPRLTYALCQQCMAP